MRLRRHADDDERLDQGSLEHLDLTSKAFRPSDLGERLPFVGNRLPETSPVPTLPFGPAGIPFTAADLIELGRRRERLAARKAGAA